MVEDPITLRVNLGVWQIPVNLVNIVFALDHLSSVISVLVLYEFSMTFLLIPFWVLGRFTCCFARYILLTKYHHIFSCSRVQELVFSEIYLSQPFISQHMLI